MDSTSPWKVFCKQAGLYKILKQLKLYQGGIVLSVLFFKFYIWLSRGFHLKKFKIIHYNWFLRKRAKETLVVNNKEKTVFMSGNYRLIVAPWKFDAL